jgi:predicted nucleic acid-binding protein
VSQGYLLDTNAISEIRKKEPNAGVLSLFRAAATGSFYLSVLTLGELRRGAAIKSRRHPEMTDRYAVWINSLEVQYANRILGVDQPIATLWGELTADRSRTVVDALLAATAIHHDLTLVTRNTRDVADLPVKLLNPWQE